MRKIIQHFIHFGLLLTATTGHTASTELRFEAAREHAIASAYSLVLPKKEIQVLYPFSTVMQKPYCYRVEFEKGRKSGCVFLLGTCHMESASVIPWAFMHDAGQATSLLPEVDSFTSPSCRSEEAEIKGAREKAPVEKCLQSDQTFFVPPSDGTGWLSLAKSFKEEIHRKIVGRFGHELAKYVYLTDPIIAYDSLLSYTLAQLGIHFSDEDMDGKIEMLFRQKNRTIYPLESHEIRSDLCRKSNIRPTRGYVEEHVEDISLLFNPCNRSTLHEQYSAYQEARKTYCNGNIESDDSPTDVMTNIRNEYWINHTLEQAFSPGNTSLVAVGVMHLNMGCAPNMGPTGLLNFLTALKHTGKTWRGIQVRRIERLVGVNPDSDLTSERNLYEWVPAEGIPTEGPFLTDMMARLS